MNSVSLMKKLMKIIQGYTNSILIINEALIKTTNPIILSDLLKRKRDYKIRIGELRSVINILVWEVENED